MEYKIIKLHNGDDLISGVMLHGDDDPAVTIALDDPYCLKQVATNNPEDHSIAFVRWIPFTDDIEFVIAKDKVVVITLASVDLAHYYEVVLEKIETSDAKIRPALSADDIDRILDLAEEGDEELLEWDEEGGNLIGGHKIDSKKFH